MSFHSLDNSDFEVHVCLARDSLHIFQAHTTVSRSSGLDGKDSHGSNLCQISDHVTSLCRFSSGVVRVSGTTCVGVHLV